MSLQFRNVDADPAGPVEQWPYEALVTAIERGTISDWARITKQISISPWGPVARQVEEYLSYDSPYGVAPLLQRAIARARRDAESRERREVAAEIRNHVGRSGLTQAEFAARVGTSRSRLSTYCTGSVMPSAALMARMRRVAEQAARGGSAGP